MVRCGLVLNLVSIAVVSALAMWIVPMSAAPRPSPQQPLAQRAKPG